MRKITMALLGGLALLSNVANAHLIAFGWKDQGNGTVRFYGQHWHGDQTSAYSDNGGVRIGVWDNNVNAASQNTATWQLFQWTGFVNNIGGDTTANNLLVTNGFLDGWAMDPDHFSNTPSENDWFFTDPFVIGNGSWGLFTGTNCCVDQMSEPGLFQLTGISSVPVGTGPGRVDAPAGIALLGLGLVGLFARRRFMK